jgi:hypothetical protein
LKVRIRDGKPVKVTYLRSQLNSQPANVKDEIDPASKNDQSWLIFPFHVIWDTSADVQDKGKQKLPLGKGTADQIVVKYPSDVGYTPGDAWELFLDSGNRVRGIHLPPWRTEKAESRHDMGGLQEGPSSTCLDGTSRNGRRQASAGVLLGRSRQAGWIRYMDKGAVARPVFGQTRESPSCQNPSNNYSLSTSADQRNQRG